MEQEIKYKGDYLQVFGHYEPYDAGDYLQPPSGDYFEVEKIMIEDTDVTELLKEHIEEIEVLVTNKIKRI